MAWEPANYIALVSVIVSPLAALGGAWLNSYLARRAKTEEHTETRRKENAQAIAPMFGILVDAHPSLIIDAQLREYDSPEAAIEGLYQRWTRAREPLLVMHYGHRSERVRKLAFDFQARVELSLRATAAAMEGRRDDVREEFNKAGAVATELARAVQEPGA